MLSSDAEFLAKCKTMQQMFTACGAPDLFNRIDTLLQTQLKSKRKAYWIEAYVGMKRKDPNYSNKPEELDCRRVHTFWNGFTYPPLKEHYKSIKNLHGSVVLPKGQEKEKIA